MLRSGAARAARVCCGFMTMRFFDNMKNMPWALCLSDIDSNLSCLEALKSEISNLVVWKMSRLLQACFSIDEIKRVLMLMSEIPWSTLSVEQARGSAAPTHELHPMTGSEMIARRSMMHLSRALSFPSRC